MLCVLGLTNLFGNKVFSHQWMGTWFQLAGAIPNIQQVQETKCSLQNCKKEKATILWLLLKSKPAVKSKLCVTGTFRWIDPADWQFNLESVVWPEGSHVYREPGLPCKGGGQVFCSKGKNVRDRWTWHSWTFLLTSGSFLTKIEVMMHQKLRWYLLLAWHS